MAFVAGIIMMSRFNSARVGYGDGYLLVSIVGAYSWRCRSTWLIWGNVFKVVFALFVLQVVACGLNLLRAYQHLIMVIWRLILLCAMVFGHVQKVLQEKKSQKYTERVRCSDISMLIKYYNNYNMMYKDFILS